MVGVVGEQGYAQATIARVAERAGVDHGAFYELFSDRHACFLAALDDSIARTWEQVQEAYEMPAKWHVRVRAALTCLLELFDEQPALARLMLIDYLDAGERVMERHTHLFSQLVEAVRAGERELAQHDARASRRDGGPRGHDGAVSGRDGGASGHDGSAGGRGGRHGAAPLDAEGVVRAALSVVQTRLLDEDSPPLIELVNPLMAMIVLPYMGWEAAAHELARPAPVKSARGRPAADPFAELGLRVTHRTVAALQAIADVPGANNALIAKRAGIADQAQVSRLLTRLKRLGLIHNDGRGVTGGRSNEWTLTARGAELERTMRGPHGPA